MEAKAPQVPNEAPQKLIDALQNDFRILQNEAKKKHPQLKEVCSPSAYDLGNGKLMKNSHNCAPLGIVRRNFFLQKPN